ncbi:hypothetical protein [Roseomonas elaeocarpi]|uniref:AntA/AntB antirepressor domain-containing protein n=1 Tax=Roseomonas elaeocarpi TaxID=907779 RepID=A0ABV6JNF9_9PROT
MIPGAGSRRRHRRKYAQGHLGEDTSFFFRGPDAKLNLRAHNLTLFVQMGEGLDEETWQHHRQQGDYSRWLRDCVKDEELAAEVEAVERSDAPFTEARAAMGDIIQRRYTVGRNSRKNDLFWSDASATFQSLRRPDLSAT